MNLAKSPLVVIAGPTASGKSSLAITLALRFGGEVISCDSVAVYRDFEIGAAKPSRDDRARVPHHLIDVVPPDAFFTAGEYARLARAAAQDISGRGRLPIVCGGTGLYLRAMLDGLFAGPERNEELRDRLRERKREGALWRLLRRLDAETARRIHPRDEPKLIRAIEVCAASGRPMSELLRDGRDALQGYRVLRIGLSPERSALYERINQRCEEMFENGLIDETRKLLERYGPEIFSIFSLGYKQAAEYLRGECSFPEALARMQQGHRNYAKRQLTWFRREPEMVWIEDFGPAAAARAEELVRKFLAQDTLE
ncbi:MAG: tRNA (adenosine(37)-N6)-dimethylallyltransferase MiaA [Acidobacteria bacterium]|nr:MAG: tRNA (adenosine(37)-N6)-dimethylallyltransferase MiaA [Acidobacteriota bacterium]